MSEYKKLLKIVSKKEKDKAQRVPSNRTNVPSENVDKFVTYLNRKRKGKK